MKNPRMNVYLSRQDSKLEVRCESIHHQQKSIHLACLAPYTPGSVRQPEMLWRHSDAPDSIMYSGSRFFSISRNKPGALYIKTTHLIHSVIVGFC